MFEIIILSIFAGALFLTLFTNTSILYALIFGFLLFFMYGLCRKYTVFEMISFSLKGIKTVKNILITFLLIGIITAFWRAGGTIAFIVYHATRFCNPRLWLLLTFLLCCLISYLTGTSFGTSATIGVICITMANSMGIPILFSGGAVLAGAFFGDRCSPMSTSALLVSSLTKTDLFNNIAVMLKTALFPFLLTCAFYLFAGLCFHVHHDSSGMQQIFADSFHLHPVMLVPAVVIFLFSILRFNVKITMSISIICAGLIMIVFQKFSIYELLSIAIWGFHPSSAELSSLLSGGGIQSMLKVFCIVCLSSCYSGIFNGTGMLDGIRNHIKDICKKCTPFGGILITSIITAMISCNQTLSIMLTQQLCCEAEPDCTRMASHLENTAVVVAPLIPWCIAGAVPLATIGAPGICILTAVYLYLIPLWNLAIELKKSAASD